MKQFGVGLYCCLCSRENSGNSEGGKGETVKWVVDHGGKGGQVIRDSRGDGSGCVAEEQDDLQEGFFFSRQGTFLIAKA